MFDWLFEGRQSVYIILAAATVIVGGLWARAGFVFTTEKTSSAASRGTPQRRIDWMPLALASVLLFGLVYFLLDRMVETGREQMSRKLQEMAGAVKKREINLLFSHISERFRFRTLDKAGFRLLVDEVIRQGLVDEVVVWDVTFPDNTGKVHFRAKPKGDKLREGPFALVRGEFVRDPDGQWRLKTFEIFRPDIDSNQPVQIPLLP